MFIPNRVMGFSAIPAGTLTAYVLEYDSDTQQIDRVTMPILGFITEHCYVDYLDAGPLMTETALRPAVWDDDLQCIEWVQRMIDERPYAQLVGIYPPGQQPDEGTTEGYAKILRKDVFRQLAENVKRRVA
jgi:hypothetical protein